MIPFFPEFAPVALEQKDEIAPVLAQTPDGVSEFTFANLYLFRARYDYKVSWDADRLLVSGERDGKKFFATPCAAPSLDVLKALFDTHDYWKGISERVIEDGRQQIAELGLEIAEDRDNFDYLYLKRELSALSGKKFHKKKNLVNAFMLANPEHSEIPLTRDKLGDAIAVLDRWKVDKGSDGDYVASREALELFDTLGMDGRIFYVKNHPAGYCLGEPVARGTMYAVHFEKAIDEYKGIYQYINQVFCAGLPENFTYINREQDLGDEGLRQAKETYRPCGFVKKHTGKPR
ncbi:ABC transporter permease [Spirochaetia bacterium]|nr:ABC transporter permease [Spirochaetia bacterium]